MKHGFSLVELSIVLVILGLLTGGILAGQSLIRAAELRSVTTQFQRYQTAAQAFRDKYFAIPGDFNNAQAIWGVANATPATCVTTASSSPLTCNGDSDGAVLPSTGSNEYFRFWQHLANAGLIEGQYDGITHGGSNYSVSTANSPISKITGGLWFVESLNTAIGNGTVFTLVYNNYLEMGAAITNGDAYGVLLRPEELWNIDTKLDDGKPAQGKVIARNWSTCTTAATNADYTADYRLTSSSIACSVMFRQAF